ncbi:MAG: phenylacetate--CoA ligase [Clostridiales bacterium]|nr:phenylacetate--CoA ligase [Clostridiales bacterium]MDD6871626.1 phenylacetate--CoA ligase [Clostridiales bacterium]MDD7368193.1 phenylacetate--CoA ligase [Clostridiales bacterium]MDY2871289.1 phenylacetate--CoA ligase [Eubacteriales bacterium]
MAYYQESVERMPREALRKLQSERLVAQVKRMYERVECFRKRMDEMNLRPEDIHGLEDLPRLPFSYKKDLRDYYPYGLFAEPLKSIVRVHASSGTTGKRIVVGYTREDLEMWADCIARMLTAIGVGAEDIVQVAFGYGLFTGGFGAHAGAERVGATVVPISAGNTALQIQTMIDFKSTVLCCTPSYAMYLGEEIEKLGVKDQLSLKCGIFGAEPWTESMRAQIEEKLGIKAYDIYGLSEIMGPGVSYECECQAGMHVNEDNFIPEIIDPDTGEVLPEGATGELVFTTLTKQGFPLIRYRTRDICSLNYEPCACGRTHIRMNKPSGRSDDMLIIRGVNVFPSQIEEVLLKVSVGDITPNYQIIVDRVNNNDTFDVNVEMSEQLFADDVKSIEKIEKQITAELRSVLGIGAKVHLVNPKSIERSEGKAKRVIDRRRL